MLERLDSLRSRRLQGNHKIPKFSMAMDLAKQRQIFDKIETSLSSGVAPDVEQVHQWKKELESVLHLERWGRYLHLEHSLEIASRSGDLLFAALLLRSMGEETLRLLVLEYPVESPYLSFKNSTDALTAWLAGAFIALEPLVRSHDHSIKKEEHHYFQLALASEADSPLKQITRSLNDYVHPNFGSHVLAIFPEQSASSKLLIEAAIGIYEAFLSMGWASSPLQIEGQALDDPYLTSLPKIAWRLENRIIPEIQKVIAPKSNSVSTPSFLEWLKNCNHSKQAFLENDAANGLLASLKPLAQGIEGSQHQDIKTLFSQALVNNTFPLRFRGVSLLLNLSTARTADEVLTSASEKLESPMVIGSSEWFNFVAYALHLALSTTILKIELLVAQAGFQIASQNQMGAVLCARSILEHQAAVLWLIDRLETSWDEISKRVCKGTLSENHLRKIDKGLADFLTGSKGSQEQTRQWSDGWETTGKHNLNLLSTVDVALGKDTPKRKVYDITSAMVHGRLMRGLEILSLQPSDRKYLCHNLLRALVAAEEVCNTDNSMSIQSRSIRISMRLQNVSNGLGLAEHSQASLERAFLNTKFKPGRHYLGSGTQEDPIRFKDGILYHEAFYKLCSELGVDSTKRRSDVVGGKLADIVEDGDRVIYFLAAPPPGFSG
jgi:hypothetical protein